MGGTPYHRSSFSGLHFQRYRDWHMTIELWDKHGHAVAYVDGDKESIYMQDGTPAGGLSGNGVYAYSGKFLGWLYKGWIFGRDGKCVLFTERAQPGAVRPFRQPAT